MLLLNIPEAVVAHHPVEDVAVVVLYTILIVQDAQGMIVAERRLNIVGGINGNKEKLIK